jgi:outer membrane autotransporter protein
VNNWGAISCSSGDGIDLYANTNTINNHGTISAGDDAIYMESSNNTINNWGTITSPGDAVYVYGQDIYTNNVVNNWGTITSANDTGVYLDTQDTLNNWGNINGGSYGVELYDPTNTVTNYFSGKITGASSALFLDDDNQTVTNWGTLSTPSTGSGVIYDDGDAFNVITNHGYIFGNGGPAIVLNSTTDETINMVGHSVVVGPIEITGVGNVVNFNLTGLSPAKIAALNAILIPQGVNSGNVTNSVVFTLNGVNYNIDPATVYFHATSYEAQALTPNQFAIARSLDSLNSIPTPSLMALFNAIDASGNVPGALNALSPVKYALYGDLAIENATATVQGVDRRLNNLRDGSESVDTTGVGGDTVAAVVTGDPSKDGSKESKQVVQPEPQENRWGFFASGDGLFFRGSQGTGLQDGKSNTAGALAGVDGKVGDHVVIGALFAYNNSAVDLGNDGSHATIESYSGGIYGSYNQDGFYLNSLAAYTRNNYTSSSNVLFPGFATTGNGSTHGNQYAANIDGGYDWNVTNRLTLGPIAGLQYVHLDVNSFDESGGGADLGVDSQSVNSLQSRLGAKAEYKIAMTAHSSFGAEAYVAWQHEYLDNSRGIGASFEGGGLTPFTVQTGSPERDAAVVGAALNCTFHNRLTLFADYELQMWNQNYFEQSVNGGAKISW